MPSEFAVEAENLRRSFRSGRREILALDGINFRVKRGEIFGLLGSNGAGKSTTIRILTTILLPSSGTARILGHDVVADPLAVRHSIAVVLQETAVETLLSVRDNLRIYGQLHDLRGREVDRRMEQVLEQFGLKEKQNEKAQDLSLGMRRRLQIAKVFMTDAPVLFLDEATTGMDPIIKRQTLESIRTLANNGRTVVLTTQLLHEAESLCDHILILNSGREVASGDLEKLRSLVARRFHVAITFADHNPEAIEAVRKLQPLSIDQQDRTIEMRFEGQEARILQDLAKISEKWRLDRLEIRGADLEDIFMDLVGGRKK